MSAVDCAKTIQLALESTYRSLGGAGEIVLHLDPSKDESQRVIEELSIPNLRCITTSERIGFARGLNLAIELSRFDFVARMDADDICLPWRFPLQKRILLREKVDALYSTAIVYGKPVRPFGIAPQLPISLGNEEVSIELVFRNPLVHPTLFMRREAVEAIGGYRESAAEDYDLALRFVLADKKIMRHWLPTVAYRLHEDQVTADPLWQAKVYGDEMITHSRAGLRKHLTSDSGSSPELLRERILKGRPLLRIEGRGVPGIIARTEKG